MSVVDPDISLGGHEAPMWLGCRERVSFNLLFKYDGFWSILMSVNCTHA